jgi:hypothetical protein
MAERIHVKAGTTTVSVVKSQADLLVILRRYGARDFGFDEDPNGKEASVRFRVTHGARDLPVLMRVDVDAVYRALFPVAPKGYGKSKDAALATRREQAKRTAWRLLIDWIDAACSTTAIGLQSVEEVFLAHIVVRDHNDRPKRLIEAFHDMQAGGSLPLSLPRGVS